MTFWEKTVNQDQFEENRKAIRDKYWDRERIASDIGKDVQKMFDDLNVEMGYEIMKIGEKKQ
jgi:hypothetical protein